MQAHFDTVGPAGRRMMRCTASTQVCLDWWPGRAGLEQWRVLNLAGPHLAAAIRAVGRARTPGSRPGSRSTPTARRSTTGCCAVGTRWRRTPDFARGATPFTGPDEHLSTLFPPVRPRGRYLEVRFLDVQPEERVAEVVGGPHRPDVRRRRAGPDPRRARARGAAAGRAVARGGRGRARSPGTSRGMKTLFVTDPLAGLSRRHRRVGRPDGRLPGRGRRGLGLRAAPTSASAAGGWSPGPAGSRCGRGTAAPTTAGSSSRAGTTRSSTQRSTWPRPASWSGCGSTHPWTRDTCTPPTSSTWRPRPASASSTTRPGCGRCTRSCSRCTCPSCARPPWSRARPPRSRRSWRRTARRW